MAKLVEETIQGIPVLRLSGSLTPDGVPDIERGFKKATAPKGARVVIDVEKVDAITTPAITLFLSTVRAAEATGGKVVFANVQGITGDIFARCRLDVIFTLAGNVDDAI